MIFVTGDTHGSITSLMKRIENVPELVCPIEDTILFVTGDFGFYWDKSVTQKYDLQTLSRLPFDIAVVLGNHENYDMIWQERKEVLWHGNVVWQMEGASNIYIMPNGVVEVQGKTILCARGADSIDKGLRIPGISWWGKEEMGIVEQQDMWNSLYWYHNNVDYVITHSMPATLVTMIYPNGERSNTEKLLDIVAKDVSFDKWYCGHYHVDITKCGKYELLYYDVLQIEKGRDDELRWENNIKEEV